MASVFLRMQGPVASCFAIDDGHLLDPGHWKQGDGGPWDPVPPWCEGFGVSEWGCQERDLVLWALMWELGQGTHLIQSDFKWTLAELPDSSEVAGVRWEWAGTKTGAFAPPEARPRDAHLPTLCRVDDFQELVFCGQFSAYTGGRDHADRVCLWSLPEEDLEHAIALLRRARRPELRDVLGNSGLLQVWHTSAPVLSLYSNAPLEAKLAVLEHDFLRRVDRARLDISGARTNAAYLKALQSIVGGWYKPKYANRSAAR
jgi:hypothetical protein